MAKKIFSQLLITNHAPQSVLSLCLYPLIFPSDRAFERIRRVSFVISIEKEGLLYVQRSCESTCEARSNALRDMQYSIQSYEACRQLQEICLIEDMEEKQQGSRKQQQRKILKFLSQHESQSSELQDNKFRNIPSGKIMKKLKELWNRQRFLTDDECQSSIDPAGSAYLEDSSMNGQVDELLQSPVHPRKAPPSRRESQLIKNLHKRQVSSSDQQLSLPHKIKKRRQCRSQNKVKPKDQCSIKEELSQIEAFNSAIQNFSSS